MKNKYSSSMLGLLYFVSYQVLADTSKSSGTKNTAKSNSVNGDGTETLETVVNNVVDGLFSSGVVYNFILGICFIFGIVLMVKTVLRLKSSSEERNGGGAKFASIVLPFVASGLMLAVPVVIKTGQESVGMDASNNAIENYELKEYSH